MITGKSGILFKVIAGCALAAGLGRAEAELVTFLPASADAAMRSDNPDVNYGSSPALFVGVSRTLLNPPTNHSLLRFDLAGVPTDATIISATLRIVVVSTSIKAADNFDLCRMLKGWGEGAQSGLPAAAGESSWNARVAPGSPWGAGGGQADVDFVAVPSCTATIAGPGSTNDFSSAGMVDDLQFWLNQPEANFGWILLASGELPGTGRQIGSRESSVTNSPVLELHYTVPTVPTPATPPDIFGVALTGNQIRFSFNAESNRTYTVEFKDALTNGTWGVLTNIPVLPAPATLQITNIISTPQRFFRARTP
jgi:hypothetical protein